jgi:hypothetical protein
MHDSPVDVMYVLNLKHHSFYTTILATLTHKGGVCDIEIPSDQRKQNRLLIFFAVVLLFSCCN